MTNFAKNKTMLLDRFNTKIIHAKPKYTDKTFLYTFFLDLREEWIESTWEYLPQMPRLKGLILNTDFLTPSTPPLVLPVLEDLILVGKQGNFPTWIADLPALKSIKFLADWQTALPTELRDMTQLEDVEIYLRPESNLKSALPRHIKRLGLYNAFTQQTFRTIAECTHLTWLSIENTNIHTGVQKLFLPEELNELSKLEYLYIYAPHLPLEFAENLRQWHHLQELTLQVENVQNFLPAEALKQVHTLKIDASHHIRKVFKFPLDKVLERCNPETLQNLIWINGKIKEIPDNLRQFKHLKKLNFSYNKFKFVPEFMLELPLEDFFIYKTSFAYRTQLEPKHSWRFFKQQLEKQNWDLEMQKFALALLQKDDYKLKNASQYQFLKLLETDNCTLHDLLPTQDILEQYVFENLPEDFDGQKEVFFMVGKPMVYYKKNEFKKRMKAKGARLAEVLDDSVTYLIVGKNPQQVQNIPDVPHIISFQTIADWLTQAHTGNFEEEPLDMQELENFRLLLSSGDASNIALALQMMRTGGIPQELYGTFFWAKRNSLPTRTKKLYEEVLVKYYPTAWQMAVDTLRSKGNIGIVYELVRKTLPTEICDEIFLALLRDFPKIATHDRIYGLAFQMGGKTARFMIRSSLKDHVLNMNLIHSTVIPQEIVEFPHIREIIFYSTDIFDPVYFPLLAQLPQLEKITFIHHYGFYKVDKAREILPHVTFV